MNEPETPMLRGGCFCGTIRYETEGQSFHETICHCVDCRRAVGAVSVAWFTIPKTSFHITVGVPTSFRSGAEVTRRFCGTCGTSLTYEHDALPDEIDVITASLDDLDTTPPKDHVHAASRPAWVVLSDGLPIYPGSRTKS